MNASRCTVALCGTLLAWASLFAQTPQPGTGSTPPGRMPLEGNRLQHPPKQTVQGLPGGAPAPREPVRQDPLGGNLNPSARGAQSPGVLTKKAPVWLHYAQKTTSRRMIRQKHDARNVK